MIEGAVFRGSSFLKKKDMIKKYILCLGLCIGMFMSQAQREYTAFDKAFHSVSSNEIMEFVYEMCKPEHKGRLAGSPVYGFSINPRPCCPRRTTRQHVRKGHPPTSPLYCTYPDRSSSSPCANLPNNPLPFSYHLPSTRLRLLSDTPRSTAIPSGY